MRGRCREQGVSQVDGTRDRPPGKTAENWSRRDGIRAGAVSGPVAERAAAIADAAPTSAGRPPRRRAAAADAGAAGVRRRRRRAGARPAGGRRGMREWIALGALAAVGDRRGGRALPADAPARRSAARRRRPPRRRRWPPAPVAPRGRRSRRRLRRGARRHRRRWRRAIRRWRASAIVRLRIGPGLPAGAAGGDPGGAGGRRDHRRSQVEPLPFEIATSRVGYYRAADLAAAEALGRVVTPVIAAGGDGRGPRLRPAPGRCRAGAPRPLGRGLSGHGGPASGPARAGAGPGADPRAGARRPGRCRGAGAAAG